MTELEELTPTPGPGEVRPSEPVSSGRRRTSEAPLVESWRDVLLRLSLGLPINAELEQITRQFVEGLAPILPNAALGACVVSANGAGPVVVSRLPPGVTVGVGRDPTRLFPGLHDERIFELEDGASGSTLHVGSAQQVLSPLQVQIGAQAAQVLAAAVKRARLYTRAEESARSMRKLEAQVIQNEKLASLGQIVAGVVHELNNPLTSIIAYSDYLKRKANARAPYDDLEDDLERLRRIGEAAARILNFSRDLVAYARPSADVPGAVQVQDIVEKALVFCEHEFNGAKIRVEREFDARLPPVRGMAGQLTQVFVNLFTNAAHAMTDGGVLRVRMHTNPKQHTLTIEVSDTGTGIDEHDMPQIFEPFFTTKTEGRGTGLGLSIVHGIMDAHGGTIEASSVVGEGTVFLLNLPLAAVVPSLLPPG
ncbi:MAG TPA: ATP-binding protein [Polyangiaceae bacterium]|jgi:signal transduction histidine kinase|nr:ATP-binding protein [Polyangiaceae bacterium]